MKWPAGRHQIWVRRIHVGFLALALLRECGPMSKTTKGAMDPVTHGVTSEQVAPFSPLPSRRLIKV